MNLPFSSTDKSSIMAHARYYCNGYCGIILKFPPFFRFFNTRISAIIRPGTRLIEDTLAYPSDHMLSWPFSHEKRGPDWLTVNGVERDYHTNFCRIANEKVMVIGLPSLLVAILVYTILEVLAQLTINSEEQLSDMVFKNRIS